MRPTAHPPRVEAHEQANDLSERLSRAYVTHALAGLLPRRRSWLLKRALDVSVALALIVATAPARLVVALGLWIRLHQSPIVRRQCAGRGGRVFTLRQFQAPPGDSPEQRDDDVSAWLSASRLARLPALHCALMGDMSLVGPAPSTVEAAMRWPARDLARLYVAPGMLRLRPVGRMRRAHTQADADLLYVTQGSVWVDAQQVLAAMFLPKRRFVVVAPSESSEP